MKVLIINTSERVGGAAIAANRLMQALKRSGTHATMLVRDRQTDSLSVSAVPSSWLLPLKFLWERLVIFLNNGWQRRQVFAVDIANTGTDITRMKEFRQADVVHLHWVNQAFLSLRTIERILASGKRVVVTMHDMWYITAVCHHANTCTRYETECARCPFLHCLPGIDLARNVFRRKQQMYARHPRLTFVGCSRWITRLAERSALTDGRRCVSIPNPIDTTLFAPADKAEARRACQLPDDPDLRLLLFTCRRITDEAKGFRFLSEACRILQTQHPDLAAHTAIVVVGDESAAVREQIDLPVYSIDYVSSEQQMVQIYNAVDLYVTPSLQDNLPNTIMEAMACAVPCVGFDIGGIPEMIDDRQSGYVARYRDAQDFADGIVWALHPDRYDDLSRHARQKVLDNYTEERIAKLYMDIYADA